MVTTCLFVPIRDMYSEDDCESVVLRTQILNSKI